MPDRIAMVPTMDVAVEDQPAFFASVTVAVAGKFGHARD